MTDVFALDAITEMLASPLRLLSYLSCRARYNEKLLASHEHMLLSYHLKRNLWVDDDVDVMHIGDDISRALDLAMAVRRDGIPGAGTPDGILTRFEGTPFARIIAEIEDKPEAVATDLGFMLLELAEDTVQEINKCIGEILKRFVADSRFHNMSIGIPSASTGLTVHCGRSGNIGIDAMLRQHCEVRKYSQKTNSWFGLTLNEDGSILVAAELVGEWKFDPELEILTKRWGI